MVPKKGTCKNHPERKSSRRCFHCKEYVCAECQQIHEHHFFCGLNCYYKWKIEPTWNWLKGQKQYTFILLLILFSDIVLYVLLRQESIQPLKNQSIDSMIGADSSWIKLDTSRIFFNYALNIELEMKGTKQPVLLWKNGKFISSVGPKQGRLDFGQQYFSSGKNSFSLWTVDQNGHSSLIDSFTIHFSSARIDYLKKQADSLERKKTLR